MRINGLARARSTSFRPVKLSGKYTDSNGQNHQFASTRLEIRFNPTLAFEGVPADGTITPTPPSSWPDRLALAGANTDVAEVFDIMGRAELLSWADLYKVHEIIRGSIKPHKIPDLGWADKATDWAFTGSANLPGVSGSDARHARMEGDPKRTMTIDEGRAFISDVVTKWLNSLG